MLIVRQLLKIQHVFKIHKIR